MKDDVNLVLSTSIDLMGEGPGARTAAGAAPRCDAQANPRWRQLRGQAGVGKNFSSMLGS